MLLLSISTYPQKRFFKVYTDSAALVQDANTIVSDFSAKVNARTLAFVSQPVAVLNTQPFLIFYAPESNTVNLPIWQQVIPGQKDFFYELAGGKEKGEELFGLFFNGFYLAHELGHALRNATKKMLPIYIRMNMWPTKLPCFIGEKLDV